THQLASVLVNVIFYDEPNRLQYTKNNKSPFEKEFTDSPSLFHSSNYQLLEKSILLKIIFAINKS
ncbi:hypothetical protein, partial [Pseudomonas ficuserectae]|uniref:hypothetical protein n=1 Tax=Pseudomonas ficuserectae TaxID=53410 RepID=UPI001C3F27EC